MLDFLSFYTIFIITTFVAEKSKGKMKSYKQSQEIISGKLWQIHPRFVHAIQPIVDSFIKNKSERAGILDDEKNLSGWFALRSKNFKNRHLVNHPKDISKSDTETKPVTNGEIQEKIILSEDPVWDMQTHWYDEEGPLIGPDDEFINVIEIKSAITRYGGWCSSGSIEHRDQMIFASQFPNCIGHLFIIDSPGGSSYAKNDYQQGIEAARAAGQPIVSLIDGGAYSAAVAASCQTDEVYARHPNCEYGCIGTMAAFYTLADGSSDEDGFVYHEKYDPESFNKNESYRELANNNNPDPLLAELAEDGAAFRSLVKSSRPAVSEDMLHGNIYKASEVMGVFIDGIKSLDEVIQRIVDLHEGNAEPIKHAPLVTIVDKNDDYDQNPTERKTIISIKTN